MEHFGAAITAQQVPTIMTYAAVVLRWVCWIVGGVQVECADPLSRRWQQTL